MKFLAITSAVAALLGVSATGHAQDTSAGEDALAQPDATEATAADPASESDPESAAESKPRPVVSEPADSKPWYPIEIGVRLDTSFSRFGVIPGFEQNYRAFPSAGLAVRLQFLRGVGLQTGLSYIRKGSSIPEAMQKSTGDYLVVPFFLRVFPTTTSQRVQPYALVGGYAGVLFGGTFRENGADPFDAGVTAGAGISWYYRPGWIVDFSVQMHEGLRNISEGTERTNRSLISGLAIMWDRGGDLDRDKLLNRHETRKCWLSTEDWDGSNNDDDGCADPNNDGDAFLDAADMCPDEAEDEDDFEDWDGCPDHDNDEDGVKDTEDKCADEPFWEPLERPADSYVAGYAAAYKAAGGVPDNLGCPISRFGTTDNAIFFVTRDKLILKSQHALDGYEPRTATPSPNGLAQARYDASLDEIARFLKQHPFIKLTIRGHSGKGENTKKLYDEERAKKVKEYLEQQGKVNPVQLVAVGVENRWPANSDCKYAKKVKPEPISMLLFKKQLKDELEKKLSELPPDVASATRRAKRREFEGANKSEINKHRGRLSRYQAYARYLDCSQNNKPGQNLRVSFLMESIVD